MSTALEAPRRENAVQDPGSDDDLSDAQIEALLQRAEARLAAQDKQLTSTTSSAGPRASSIALSTLAKPYIQTDGEIAHADATRLLDPEQRKLAGRVRKIEDPATLKARKAVEKKATAGPDWYHLPRTRLTPSLKRDLQLIKMRSVLDPKQHYKKDASRATIPEYSQIGTIVSGPTEWFSGRLARSERKATLADEVLQGERESGKFRKRYLEIQAAKRSGKKGEYRQKMKEKYRKGRRR